MYAGRMWILKTLGVIAAVYLALAGLMYAFQDKLLYFPGSRMGKTPQDAELPYEDVWLTTREGTRIHGWFVPREAARLTVLFSHGNGGNVSHRLETLRIFHDLGASILVYDYSGYGLSEGSPSERATQADARAAWDWLVRERGVAPDTIMLLGRSLGGAVSAGLARELAEEGVSPAGFVMEGAFTSVPDVAARIYPWLPVRLLARFEYDAVKDLANVRVPGLFLHSPQDETVPFEVGVELFQAYEGPKRFVELQGSHSWGFMESGRLYIEAMDAFVRDLESGR